MCLLGRSPWLASYTVAGGGPLVLMASHGTDWLLRIHADGANEAQVWPPSLACVAL
jgi:hypothetical protein